jgi:hypothetical protein
MSTVGRRFVCASTQKDKFDKALIQEGISSLKAIYPMDGSLVILEARAQCPLRNARKIWAGIYKTGSVP